jgi:hypothetical protein
MPAAPEMRLQLRDAAVDIEKLRLFYETAQPLARLLVELPPMRDPRVTFRVQSRMDTLSQPMSVEKLLQDAESKMVLDFPHLPEPLFERLCLRFRPFYMEKEDTNFLGITQLLKAQNPELRANMDARIKRWDGAIFWGRMAMKAPSAPGKIEAEDVIKAGFYSSYFHVTAKRRAAARAYEAALGPATFRIALVSSVWERSFLVVKLAAELRDVLLAQGWATQAELLSYDSESAFFRDTQLIVEAGGGRVTAIPRWQPLPSL